jgi:hypothetical protein
LYAKKAAAPIAAKIKKFLAENFFPSMLRKSRKRGIETPAALDSPHNEAQLEGVFVYPPTLPLSQSHLY